MMQDTKFIRRCVKCGKKEILSDKEYIEKEPKCKCGGTIFNVMPQVVRK